MTPHLFRDKKQEEFARTWLKTMFGILYLCPRFGKIKTTLKIISLMTDLLGKAPLKILIIYPIETIKKSWTDDIEKWGYNPEWFSFISTASLWKLAANPEFYDLIVMDEVQLFSSANLQEMKDLIDAGNQHILGLSGTISNQTAQEIRQTINLPILAEYTIENGIRDKVITDYEINVVMTKLDSTYKYIQPSKKYPNFKVTEAERYAYLTNQIEEIKEETKRYNEAVVLAAEGTGQILDYEDFKKVDLGLLPIHRMHLLKKSHAKLTATKMLMDKFADQRILVFCGVTEIADKLGVPVYHSKNKDKEVKDAFCRGEGNALVTVDMFEAGVTVKPINLAVLNSFDSNPENLAQRISRITGFEYDSPDKIAVVYIICTNTIEKEWLVKALEFFDLTKVKYHELHQLFYGA